MKLPARSETSADRELLAGAIEAIEKARAANNRESFPLRGRKIKNPPSLWIRTNGSIAPGSSALLFSTPKDVTLRWLP
jgi:hypothetical protein